MAGKRNTKSHVPPASVSWLDKLAAEINVPFAPPGWFTVSEICQKLDRDHQVVRVLLKKRGAEVRKFRHRKINGNVIITNHYKL